MSSNLTGKQYWTGRLRHLAGCLLVLFMPAALGQDDTDPAIGSPLDGLNLPPLELPLCFGLRDITDLRALAVCDALRLEENVRAREQAEDWVRAEPENPAAQFALAEVLYEVEANVPRALYHLNRAEDLTDYSSLGRALASGNYQWHFLTLSQLSNLYQLIGDQEMALAYLDKIEEVYAADMEPYRGWPLAKLERWDAARDSANKVLTSSDDQWDRARALNTLCFVELASLQPIENLEVCDMAYIQDDDAVDAAGTVDLTNASEVALSVLRIDQAESYLDRAARYLNPDSVADPWIYKLFLTVNQGRFEEAREAFDRMLLWRENQVPVVTVRNRAEHLLVSASFLILIGYGEDAVKLTSTALAEPDRNGSYSADDAQKDSIAALLQMLGNEVWYQTRLEEAATLGFVDSIKLRSAANVQRFDAWMAGRRAAALFADEDILLARLRPYAPLVQHIPEWVEPDIIRLIGTGVAAELLETARERGAFLLNEGYYHSYATEIAALERRHAAAIRSGQLALDILPPQEVLLRGRLHARMARAHWRLGATQAALEAWRVALNLDPGVVRRLDQSLPVSLTHDGSAIAEQAVKYLRRSPRFDSQRAGFQLEVKGGTEISACLRIPGGASAGCFAITADNGLGVEQNAQILVTGLHGELFDLPYEISDAQLSLLRGSSIIMRNQGNAQTRAITDPFQSPR